MLSSGVILYGPPASGKDTVTNALIRLSPAYVLFEKLKAGRGRSRGYRLTTTDEIERIRHLDQVVYENQRYGNSYLVDRPALDALLARGAIPVVHMGQLMGVRALYDYPAAWCSALLWCRREIALTRLVARHTADLTTRLTVWDDTAAELETRYRPDNFSLHIDTEKNSADEAARAIHSHVFSLGRQL